MVVQVQLASCSVSLLAITVWLFFVEETTTQAAAFTNISAG